MLCGHNIALFYGFWYGVYSFFRRPQCSQWAAEEVRLPFTSPSLCEQLDGGSVHFVRVPPGKVCLRVCFPPLQCEPSLIHLQCLWATFNALACETCSSGLLTQMTAKPSPPTITTQLPAVASINGIKLQSLQRPLSATHLP